MKSNWIIGTLMLGLGTAIGWVVKPAPPSRVATAADGVSASKAAASVTATPSTESTVLGKRAQREPAAKKPSNMPTEAQMDQARKMQTDLAKDMVKRHRAKLEQQIERLGDKIQLTGSQKAGLTAWLDEQMKKMESMDLSDPLAMVKLPEVAGSITNEALESQLAPSLTDEQQAAMVDFKDNELHLKVDALALKSLSKLQGVIEFEDGQRDEIYKILTKNAEVTTAAELKDPDVSKMITEGIGIEMDPYDLGLQKIMMESITDLGKRGDSIEGMPQITEKMREMLDKRIEEKIDELRPVLNEKQLARYREELKSKGMGIYQSALMNVSSRPPKK